MDKKLKNDIKKLIVDFAMVVFGLGIMYKSFVLAEFDYFYAFVFLMLCVGLIRSRE